MKMRFFRIIFKAILLFVVANALFALLNPINALGNISIYNTLVPGRVRLPFGYNPHKDYNLSTPNLNAMFASHVIAKPKSSDEFRVVLIGDSATWGYLLQPNQTLAAQLNALQHKLGDGRIVRVYNIGYPDFSLAKDVVLMQRAVQYSPDLVLWFVTLNSLPNDRQQSHFLIQHNAEMARASFFERTIVGARRDLADLIRLQLLGFMWASTGVDQNYPNPNERYSRDLEADDGMRGLSAQSVASKTLNENDLALENIDIGAIIAKQAGVRLLIVNEPVAVSDGKNSDRRYNAFYPRWAYDQYRRILAKTAQQQALFFIDAWDWLPPDEFTNTPVHRTPNGEAWLAQKLIPSIITTR
jgi:hypothetical protein